MSDQAVADPTKTDTAIKAVRANIRDLKANLILNGERNISKADLLRRIEASDLPPIWKKHFREPELQVALLGIHGDLALDIVGLLNISNRDIGWNYVDKYAVDMVTGQWKQGSVGLEFDEDNKLSNGQHRLLAIAAVGSLMPELLMPVVFHVDRESKLKQERRKIISGKDQLQFLGKDPQLIHKDTATTLKAIKNGLSKMALKIESDEYSKLFDVVANSVYRTCSLFEGVRGAGKRLNTAPIRAVVSRAIHLNWSDAAAMKRIEEFVSILRNGPGTNVEAKDSAAKKLYEAYTGNNRPPRDAESVSECYKRTQLALRKFIDEEPTNRLGMSSDQVFTIKEIDG